MSVHVLRKTEGTSRSSEFRLSCYNLIFSFVQIRFGKFNGSKIIFINLSLFTSRKVIYLCSGAIWGRYIRRIANLADGYSHPLNRIQFPFLTQEAPVKVDIHEACRRSSTVPDPYGVCAFVYFKESCFSWFINIFLFTIWKVTRYNRIWNVRFDFLRDYHHRVNSLN